MVGEKEGTKGKGKRGGMKTGVDGKIPQDKGGPCYKSVITKSWRLKDHSR